MEERIAAERKFDISRKNLLSVVIFSTINILLLLFGVSISFLFSATLPAFVFVVGQILSAETGMSLYIMVSTLLSFVIISLYGLSYLFSKKNKSFILVALIAFSIDSLFLLRNIIVGFDVSYLFEIAFHVWVMYYLIIGTKAWSDLKKMPPDMNSEENYNQDQNV